MRSITSFSGRFLALRIMPPEMLESKSTSIPATRPNSIKTSFKGTWSVTEKEMILSPPIAGGGGDMMSLETLGVGASSCPFSNFRERSSALFFTIAFSASDLLRPVFKSKGSSLPWAQENEVKTSEKHKNLFAVQASLNTWFYWMESGLRKQKFRAMLFAKFFLAIDFAERISSVRAFFSSWKLPKKFPRKCSKNKIKSLPIFMVANQQI